MVPPKKDAFADLFQSATATSSSSSLNNKNLSLAEQQKQQKPANNLSNWSNLDILSPSPRPNSNSNSNSVGSLSRTDSPAMPLASGLNNDPFDIFQSPAPAKPVSRENSPIEQVKPTPVQPAPQKINSNSLLDDDFEDAFTSEQGADDTLQQYSQLESDDFESNDFESNEPAETHPDRATSTDKKDTVLAELVDIGFSIEVSNGAIAKMGPDLQACVNYIMSGGDSNDRKPRRSHTQESNSKSLQGDFASNINDLSSDFFNKASIFFNKSKATVMKNIEQIQQDFGGEHSDNKGNNNMPAWMKNQHRYKKDAIERRQPGGNYEDYGSDEENINQEEINRFMELQRQKEKERLKQRIDHFKEVAKNKINGAGLGRSSPVKRPSNEQPPTSNSSPQLRPERTAQPPPKPQRQEPSSSRASASPKPSAKPAPQADLLGIGGAPVLSRPEKFKSSTPDDEVYVSSRRRRNNNNSTPLLSQPKQRKTISDPLNQFQQSDYDISKEKASDFFSNGNYDGAHNLYIKCLESLPSNHELRIIINSNLALTSNKLGNYKESKQFCIDGLDLVGDEEIAKDETWILNGKPIKVWYVKLLTRKAESLEMLELFPESLSCYSDLVSKFGVTDKKIMDARRRIRNIVDPPKPAPTKKPASSQPVSNIKSTNYEAVERIRKQNADEKNQEDIKFRLHDQIQERLFDWSKGKEDNLRSLLMSLPNILPERLGFPFITTKKLTINDLMLPKKVKINYMKVISSIHPDKLGKFETEDQMICQGVFIILNKSWDIFKEQNGIN